MVGVVWQLWQPGTNITFIMCDKSNIPFISTAMWPRQQSFGIFLFFCFIATLCKSWLKLFFFYFFPVFFSNAFLNMPLRAMKLEQLSACTFSARQISIFFFFYIDWWLKRADGLQLSCYVKVQGGKTMTAGCRQKRKKGGVHLNFHIFPHEK